MNRNQDCIFSTDRKKKRKATFIEDCVHLDAIRIRLGNKDWIVKRDEIYNLAKWEKVTTEQFYEDNEKMIDAWNNDKSGLTKAAICKENGFNRDIFYRTISKAKKLGLTSK